MRWAGNVTRGREEWCMQDFGGES